MQFWVQTRVFKSEHGHLDSDRVKKKTSFFIVYYFEFLGVIWGGQLGTIWPIECCLVNKCKNCIIWNWVKWSQTSSPLVNLSHRDTVSYMLTSLVWVKKKQQFSGMFWSRCPNWAPTACSKGGWDISGLWNRASVFLLCWMSQKGKSLHSRPHSISVGFTWVRWDLLTQ